MRVSQLQRATRWIGRGLACLALPSLASAQLTLSLDPPTPGPGDPVDIVLSGGTAGDYGFVLAALDAGPTNFGALIGLLDLGLVDLTIYPMGQFTDGEQRFPCDLDCTVTLFDPIYAQAIALRLVPGVGVILTGKSNSFALTIDDDAIEDCNDNGNDDDCDIQEGTSQDCNRNGIPDECEPDCNQNGVPDDCDIKEGTSQDCDQNGVPDECQPDCDRDGIPDACDSEIANYCMKNLADDDCENVVSRVVWIGDLSEPHFLLVDGGQFLEYADGTASFHAKIRRKDSSTKMFQVDVQLSGRVQPGDAGYPPVGSPKLSGHCPKQPDAWRYYTSFTGTFTGLGAYDGAVYSLSPRGPAFQLGMGGTLFNARFGASAWFHLTRVERSNGSYLPKDMEGDFNFDLKPDCDCGHSSH